MVKRHRCAGNQVTILGRRGKFRSAALSIIYVLKNNTQKSE